MTVHVTELEEGGQPPESIDVSTTAYVSATTPPNYGVAPRNLRVRLQPSGFAAWERQARRLALRMTDFLEPGHGSGRPGGSAAPGRRPRPRRP